MNKTDHLVKLVDATEEYSHEEFIFLFPDGMDQADRIITSLARYFDIDLNIFSAKDYFDILNIYADTAYLADLNHNTLYIVRDIRKTHGALVSDIKKACMVYALYLKNLENNNFELNCEKSLNALECAAGILFGEIECELTAEETEEIKKAQKEANPSDETDEEETENDENPPVPMRWFKFIVHFGLFANILTYIYKGFMSSLATARFIAETRGTAFLNSISIGTYKIYQYEGVALIVFAVFAFLIRNRLAKFKDNAHINYLSYLLLTMMNNLIFSCYALMFESIYEIIVTVVIYAVYFLLNEEYFRKRALLFRK